MEMHSNQLVARKAGVIYLIFSLLATLNEFFISRGFIDWDSASNTAANILNREPAYRLSILISFIELIFFILLVAQLNKLFKEVDNVQAMLMVLFVTLGVTISFFNLILKTSSLILIHPADYLSVYSKEQLESLSMIFLKLRSSGNMIAMAFWGLWLFPFAILVIKSGFIPKVFGYLLIVAGTGYLLNSLTYIGFPDIKQAIGKFLTPLYFGELPVIFWLLIVGTRNTQRKHNI